MENALIRFDPLIFKEAQIKVLGRAKESNYEQSFKDKFEELKIRKSLKAKEEKEKFLKEFKERRKKDLGF